MKRLLFSALAIVSLISCSSPQHKLTSSKEESSKYYELISQQALDKNLHILTSDSLEGRRTGEPGQRKAAQFLANYYRELGILNPPNTTDYFQAIPASFMQNTMMKLKDSENVWAFIKGSEKPEEVVAVSAHYDHMGILLNQIYYGADDNGSGTSAVMEIARVTKELSNKGIRPKRSILFLHLTGEEFGLFGSQFYTENPPIPLAQTIANINIDMIGRRSNEHNSSNDYIFVVGSGKLSHDLYNIVQKSNLNSVNMSLDYKFDDANDTQQIYYRSDHYNFAKNNIPAVFYYNGTHNDYHLPSDTVDKIDFPLLAKRTQLIFETIWTLANEKNRPRLTPN